MVEDKIILITGGSGSWGNELTSQLLEKQPKRIIIFSRGEISQVAMQRRFDDKRIEFVIGDIRDIKAVESVFARGIDYVFHLAALKHVPICENQPEEAIHTNITGTINLIQAAIKYKVKKFIDVSTDKAVNPINVYGMTKGIGERLVIQANCLTQDTEFICVRGGNVLGTNGSLVPHFINQIKTKNKITVTDLEMTRFFLTLQKAIGLLFVAFEKGIGGEIYIMNMPSFYIEDLAELLVEFYGNKSTEIEIIGRREGEKIHEVLISEQEAIHTSYIDSDYFVIRSPLNMDRSFSIYKKVYADFSLTSQDNIKDKAYLKLLLKEGGYLI